jgi:hypothetical protein
LLPAGFGLWGFVAMLGIIPRRQGSVESIHRESRSN